MDALYITGLVDMLPFESSTLMMIVVIIEIATGILIPIRPAIGDFVVMTWLILIALTLIFSTLYLDVAVWDLVIAAFSLAKLSNNNIVKIIN